MLGPRLIAALGTQRDRYAKASDLQAYSGIAPVVASSGKQRWVHWRWACPKFLRQTFHEWAARSIRHSSWAKAYHERQRASGKAGNTIIRAIAFKWIRILFRCWKDHQPYRAESYERALARRQAPNSTAPLRLCNCSGKPAPASGKFPPFPLTDQLRCWLTAAGGRVGLAEWKHRASCRHHRAEQSRR